VLYLYAADFPPKGRLLLDWPPKGGGYQDFEFDPARFDLLPEAEWRRPSAKTGIQALPLPLMGRLISRNTSMHPR
jgi:hypothetical protein